MIVLSLSLSGVFVGIERAKAQGAGGASGPLTSKCLSGALSGLLSSFLQSPIDLSVSTNDRAFQFDQCMQAVIETAAKVALQNLRKRLLNQIVDQTVEWIRDENEPKYVSNFNLFAKEILETAGGNTIREIGLADLYPDDDLISGIKEGIKSRITPKRFYEEISYTLNTEVDDVEEFKQDFRKGGWGALQKAAMPNNNPYGVALMAGMYADQVEEQEIAKQEAAMSGQFRSDIVCTEWVLVVKSGGAAGGVGDAYVNPNTNKEEYLHTDPLPKSEAPVSSVSGTKYICREDSESSGEIVRTPASTISSIANKVVESGIDEIISANDLESYISAIADAAINRITKEGFLMFDSAVGYFGRGEGNNSQYITPEIQEGLEEYKGYRDGTTVGQEANLIVKDELTIRVNKLLGDSSSTMREADEFQLSINSLEVALFSTSSNRGLLECMKIRPQFSPPYSPPKLVGKTMTQLFLEMHDLVSNMRTDATSHKTGIRDSIYNPSLEARDRVLVISGSTLPQIINELKNNIKNLEDLFDEKLENFTNFKTDSDEIIDNVNRNRALCNQY